MSNPDKTKEPSGVQSKEGRVWTAGPGCQEAVITAGQVMRENRDCKHGPESNKRED
jgi:hypothetical protein